LPRLSCRCAKGMLYARTVERGDTPLEIGLAGGSGMLAVDEASQFSVREAKASVGRRSLTLPACLQTHGSASRSHRTQPAGWSSGVAEATFLASLRTRS
jgi:hypothetical protein